jgi:hypothetical protein
MHLLAIEIGGSKLQIFAGNDQGSILERRRFWSIETAAAQEYESRSQKPSLPCIRMAAEGDWSRIWWTRTLARR